MLKGGTALRCAQCAWLKGEEEGAMSSGQKRGRPSEVACGEPPTKLRGSNTRVVSTYFTPCWRCYILLLLTSTCRYGEGGRGPGSSKLDERCRDGGGRSRYVAYAILLQY